MPGVAGRSGEVRRWFSADRVLGLVGGMMVLAAIFLLLRGGGGDAGAGSASPPPLELIQPADGAVVASPLELRFRSGSPLTRGPGGWGVGTYHVHASVDGIEVMPGPGDLEAVGDGSYVWVLRGLAPGAVQVQLFWSDAQHRPIEGEGGAPVTVRIREADGDTGAGGP